MPTRIRLEGHYSPLSHDDELEGVIEEATFIAHDEARQEFVLRGRDEDKTLWEAHLYSKDGKAFSGKMASKEWECEYSVEMELWVSPTSDQERLLLGTYHAVEDPEVKWCITLSPPEGD